MDAAQASAFLVFAFIAAVTPGPSNTMLLSAGAAAGRVRGIKCPIGASLGMGSTIFVSALGAGEIIAATPAVVTSMKTAGSLFLLYLAWKILNAGTFETRSQAQAAGFAQTFLFQWVNPKGWLVALSASGTYLVPGQHNDASGALWMGVLFAAAALPAGLIWFLMGSSVARFLKNERSAKRFNLAMALALAASVILVWR